MSGHLPVMLAEVLETLSPQAGQVIVDGTFGGGGYTRAILAEASCHVIGLDRDPDAVVRGKALEQEMSGRFTMVETEFSKLDELQGKSDAVVLDIGVSSFQIDQPERGFSFMQDGPLDMRMGKDGPSAADVVAQLSEGELSTLFHVYGEEREARRIARAIVTDRVATPTAEAVLPPGGRLVVVTFHSLEDRAVKTFLNDRSKEAPGSRHAPAQVGPAATFNLINRKPLIATEAEVAANPRARSAKLRAAIRTDVPARAGRVTGLGGVPTLDQIKRAA